MPAAIRDPSYDARPIRCPFAWDHDSGYFAKLQKAFRHACWVEAKWGELQTGIDADAFLDACLFVVQALKPLKPSQLLLNSTTDVEEVGEAVLDALRKTVDLRRRATCEECIEVVADFEVVLATNSTSLDIGDALAERCEERFFHHPAKADQCRRSIVIGVPLLIDFTLANFPPLIACEELKFCPRPK